MGRVYQRVRPSDMRQLKKIWETCLAQNWQKKDSAGEQVE